MILMLMPSHRRRPSALGMGHRRRRGKAEAAATLSAAILDIVAGFFVVESHAHASWDCLRPLSGTRAETCQIIHQLQRRSRDARRFAPIR